MSGAAQNRYRAFAAPAPPPLLPPAPPSQPAPTPQRPSRYRSLRGKSVSETRKVPLVVHNGGGETEASEDGGSGLVSRVGSRYRKRSKTLGAGDSSSTSTSTNSSNAPPPPPPPPLPIVVPMVPALPLSQKDPNISIQTQQTSSGGGGSGSKWPSPLRESETLGSIHRKFPAPPRYHVVPVARAITADTRVDATTTTSSNSNSNSSNSSRSIGPDRERRQLRGDAQEPWADEVARLDAETDRILAEQKKRDLARLQLQLAAQHYQNQHQHHHHPSATTLQGKGKSPVLEKFAFLSRGRRSNAATPSTASSASASVDYSRVNSLEPALRHPRTFVEQLPHRLDPPLMDAPGSSPADSQVQVQCKQLSLTLPIEAETTAVDIMTTCSDALTHPINTSCSVVVEKYPQLGLERRLRRYERIRDVLSSWDRDTHNSLLVLPSLDTGERGRGSGGEEGDEGKEEQKQLRLLDIKSVSKSDDPPQGFILQLYHAQRPGKWSKRFVTLQPDGQVRASKKMEADKEAQKLCHLTDADIYRPTEARMRKQLKPPKKYCYAIKSQQKASLFAPSSSSSNGSNGSDGAGAGSSSNHVHFFCTEDAAVAHKFFSFVHAWRSWYLVHRRGAAQAPAGAAAAATTGRQQTRREAEVEPEKAPQIVPVRHKPQKSISHVKVNHGHKVRVSIDESPYTIGAFEPLLDLNRFEKPIDDFGKDWIPDPLSRVSASPPSRAPDHPPPPSPPARRRPLGPRPGGGPASSSTGSIHQQQQQHATALLPAYLASTSTPEFAPKGLLGNDYEERRKVAAATAAAAADTTTLTPQEAFTEGPSLLNNGAAPSAPSAPAPTREPQPWFPSAAEHTARQRSLSIRSAAAAAAARRPSTSSGAAASLYHGSHGRHESRSGGPSRRPGGGAPSYRHGPGPLVSLTPKFQEAPQWSQEGKGHGVRAPAGTPLVDLATGPVLPPGAARFLEVPPRNLIRRDQKQPGGGGHPRPSTSDAASSWGGGRPRARSTAGSVAGSSRGRPDEYPPVPPLPRPADARSRGRSGTVRY